MPKQLTESLNLSEATRSADGTTGVLEVEFITPGWGSSGYYSPAVVEAAAPLFAVGTHMYFDHPTAAEDAERPVRSVKDLGAVIVEAGTVDPTTGGVVGKVKPFAPYRDLLLDEDFAKNIGVSIRGSASDITIGEAEGRTGRIVESLVDIASVDFVTRAGRGGRILQVLESANPMVLDRAISRGVAEATADERRQQLSDVVKAAHAGDKTYAWVRDFDDATVWFDISPEDDRTTTWQQSYAIADDDMSVSLTGERAEVRPVTKYVPVTRPGSTNTTESLKEDTMPQIEEARLRELEEASGRVPTLESELATEKARADKSEAELAESRSASNAKDARVIVAEHEHTFDPYQASGLMANLPLKEGVLDAEAFKTRVDEAAAELKAAGGAGQVSGFGTVLDGGAVTESKTPTANAWGRPIKNGA